MNEVEKDNGSCNGLKPRRGKWWRVLLALLCGVGTWWLVVWWLGPRAWYTAAFKLDEWIQPLPEEERFGPPILYGVREKQRRRHARIGTRLIDSEGRYLLVQYETTKLDYWIVDLHTREIVARHTLNGPDYLSQQYGDSERSWSSWQKGVVYFAVRKREAKLKDIFGEPVYRCELWQWDAFANETTLVKEYPLGTTLHVAGTSLLEVKRESVFNPARLLPLSWASYLAAEVEDYLRLQDVSIYRVWSLPEMKLRCTLTRPWMYRHGAGTLSPDGNYLVFSDEVLPLGFSSPIAVQNQNEPSSSLRHLQEFAIAPAGCALYHIEDGSLVSEYLEPGRLYDYAHSPSDQDQVLYFVQLNTTIDFQNRSFHLPSRSWLNEAIPHSTRLNDQDLHALKWSKNKDSLLEVLSIAPDGSMTHKGTIDGTDLLPGSPHIIKLFKQRRIDALPIPAWLGSWMIGQALFKSLFTTTQYLEVRDYQKLRVVFHLRAQEGTSLRSFVADPWCVIVEDNMDTMQLAVYPLPFPSWSPWWARVAGLLVMVFVWWVGARARRGALHHGGA